MNRLDRAIGICITDKDLTVRSWDPWLARATGIPAAVARTRSLAALFPDLEGRGLLRRLQRVVDEGVVEVLAPALHHYLIACEPLTPSRHFEFMQQRVTIAPLRDGESIIGAILGIEDVTDRLDRERDVVVEGGSGDEVAPAPVLTGALGHDDWRVRRAAADGLAQQSGLAVVESSFAPCAMNTMI